MQRSWEFIHNVHGGSSRWSTELEQFFQANLDWLLGQAETNPNDPYWWQVSLLFEPWQGLYAGYNESAPASQQYDRDTFYAVTLIGVMDDPISDDLQPGPHQ